MALPVTRIKLPITPAPKVPRGTGAPPSKPIAPSTYGLNTRSNAPFDPLAVPKTQGQFNQQVLNAAAPSYTPQLQQIQGDVGAENAANKQRTAQLGSIYNQYGAQATKAFQDTQSALKDLITASSTGNAATQQTMGAALNSALTGGNQLAGMMGLSAQPDAQQSQPYLAASAQAAQVPQNELSQIAAGMIGNAGAQEANVGLERTQQFNIEGQRHGAAIQSLGGQRDALMQQIPGLIEQAREKLISDLQNAQGLKFQQNLAAKQFGLSAETQGFNQQQTSATNAANIAAQKAQTSQNQQTIDLNKQSIANAGKADQAKLQQALATAQGKQQANAIKFLQSWIAPTKAETSTTSTSTKTGAVTKGSKTSLGTRDPNDALKTLTIDYGLPQDQALMLMSALNTPIGKNSYGLNPAMTIGAWASQYAFAQKYNTAPKLGAAPKGLVQNQGLTLPAGYNWLRPPG